MNPLGSAGTAHDGFVNRRSAVRVCPSAQAKTEANSQVRVQSPIGGRLSPTPSLAHAEPGGSARLGMREPATTGRCLRLTGQLSSRTEDHDPAAANRRQAFDANRSTGIRYRSRDRGATSNSSSTEYPRRIRRPSRVSSRRSPVPSISTGSCGRSSTRWVLPRSQGLHERRGDPHRGSGRRDVDEKCREVRETFVAT